jgi:hypothetical protein
MEAASIVASADAASRSPPLWKSPLSDRRRHHLVRDEVAQARDHCARTHVPHLAAAARARLERNRAMVKWYYTKPNQIAR